MNEDIKILQTDNPHILHFYREHPQLDFESINLIVVDVLKKCTTTETGQSKILSTIKDNAMKILDSNMKDDNPHNEITNKLLLQFLDIKRKYIDELNIIINTYPSLDILSMLLEENNNVLINKTSVILNDIVPKTNPQNLKIEETIILFKKSINEDILTLINSIDNNTVKAFINNFELKTNNMLKNIQQPIFSYISSCEERIQTNITNLKQMFNEQTNHNAVPKKIVPINILLNRIYSTSDVMRVPRHDVVGHSAMSNLYMMKRENCSKIMIENNAVEHNIELEDVSKFIEEVEQNYCHGILLSQHSGISSKQNYHIDSFNGYIIVYIHNVEYDPERIRVAVDIIDNLSLKLKDYGINENGMYNIDKDILKEINQEYQLFLSQKESIITVLREGQRKVISQIDNFSFPNLDKYLSTKFITPIHKQGFLCDLCKSFNANNLKALAAHKRGCTRKLIGNNMIPSNTVIC
jgi:hypothetical protein